MKTTLGPVPIANSVKFPALDMLIHKWDLAKVAGQDTFLTAGLSDACFGVVQIGVEMWREQAFFGPDVTLPITASIRDKLLTISGRQP